MWSLTKNIIFVYIYFNIGSSLAVHQCTKPGVNFNAVAADVPLPADVYRGEQNDTKFFLLSLANISENLTVTVYVNPYKRNPNDCRETPTNSSDLYKFYAELKPWKNNDSLECRLPRAPAGCYYVKMINERQQKFIVPITYYNGTSKFIDSNIRCSRAVILPPSTSIGRKFDIELEVPLQCLKVHINLFELEKPATEEIRQAAYNGKMEPIGDCWFTNTDHSCQSNKTGFFITRNLTIPNITEHWMAYIEWNKLKDEGAYYSTLLTPDEGSCEFDWADWETWTPAYKLSFIDHGYDFTNPMASVESKDYSDIVKLSLFILSALFMLMILIYAVRMYIKISNNRGQNVPSPDQEIEERLYVDKILLIYMQSTSDLMKNMRGFKSELKKRCKHEVYDIYSNDEYSAIATLRPHSWVEQIMKDGCQVVWIDTPQLRSYLNDRSKLNSEKQKDHIEVDFRDCAIKYAFELTKTSFKDLHNQYMYHFVIRLNGVDFTDEAKDPLSVITPHRRYYFPQHFDRLYADLVYRTK